ncbi:hypothetical protein MHY1_02807 [Methylovirgula sp. HY1]|nr:hypothetical protein MHY1_02807 [Methylovirgula sp. HY1]
MTRHSRSTDNAKGHEGPGLYPRSDAAPLDMRPQTALCRQLDHGLRLDWDDSLSARPARKTSLFGTPALETGRDEKARSVVALSRVPRLAGFAGSPPAVDFFQRLTGLLSGSPLLDTRPQARAIWATPKIGISAAITSVFFKPPAAAGTSPSWRAAANCSPKEKRGCCTSSFARVRAFSDRVDSPDREETAPASNHMHAPKEGRKVKAKQKPMDDF